MMQLLNFWLIAMTWLVQPADKEVFNVKVKFNLPEDKGNLLVAVYTKPETWMKDSKSFQRHMWTVTSKTQTHELSLPAGKYAISVMQDVNKNNKMDTYWYGAPKEPYGFSNNVRHALKPSTFEESLFTVSAQEQTVTINLK